MGRRTDVRTWRSSVLGFVEGEPRVGQLVFGLPTPHLPGGVTTEAAGCCRLASGLVVDALSDSVIVRGGLRRALAAALGECGDRGGSDAGASALGIRGRASVSSAGGG